MTGKQLKNSILQWAIQGKLVPQDPNDEPASVLLEKIREEKALLIKEGKIKKDKKESIIYRGEDNSYYEKFADGKVVCIDDEIPFEIPSGWVWCRLGSLVDFSKSKSVKANNIAPDAWLLDLEDIEKDSGKILHKKRKGTTTSISDKHRFERGNVLYSKLRPYLNKVIIADEDGYCTSEILCFDFGMIYNKYAQLFLMSPFFVEYAMSDAYGVKMPRLGSKQGNNGLIPIPPREEQTRIVNFINSLAPYIEKYSNAQASLDIINKEVKNTLKKSILQEAIQGKLVTQDNSDESASILLQRIKEEKLRLVKEGKLKKKDVIDSTIFRGDDNKYYEQIDGNILQIEADYTFPDTWEVVKLSHICRLMDGEKKEGKHICLDAKYLRGKSSGDILTKGRFVSTGDNIILVDGENSGEVFAVPHDGYMGSTFKQLWVSCNMHLPYVLYFIQFYKDLLRNSKKGAAIPHLNKDIFYSLVAGIPPYQEQKRIAKRIEEITNRIKG